MRHTLSRFLRPITGLAVCSVSAAVAAALFGRQPAAKWLPIVFLAVVFLVAVRFGTLVGILGSMIAAVIFAYMLFTPVSSLVVTDPEARSNLAWMLLGGTVISFLLAPGPQQHKH